MGGAPYKSAKRGIVGCPSFECSAFSHKEHPCHVYSMPSKQVIGQPIMYNGAFEVKS